MTALKVCQLCAVDFTLKKFLLPLIDGMQQEGWSVTAACSDGPYIQTLRAQGYCVETISIARSLNPISALRSISALIRFFRDAQFDVLHVHTPVAALLGRIAAKIVGVPLVLYTAHGFYFHDEMPAWKRRLYIALEWIGGRLTDFLFTQSTEDAMSAVQLGISRRERTLAIGNGVNADRFNPTLFETADARRNLGIPEQAIVIGIVGRLVREKGYVEYLQAIEVIGGKYKNIYFLVVGERLASDHNAAIDEELARAERALGKRLILAGMREDVPVLLSAMDIFCLPSYREGMPRTIIEAMMMGKPIVATNIRGSREEVIHDMTGLLVPTRDSDALERALEALVVDQDKRERMGQAGRARALSFYDEQQVIRLQIEKIRELLQPSNRISI